MLKQAVSNRSFMPLWASHFLSAVNDSFLRTVFLFFVTYQMTQAGTAFLISAVILYALCFCAGSIYAGQAADKISRVRFLTVIRGVEVGIMALALVSLFLDSRILLTLILALSGMTQPCLRAANYSLMPRLMNKAHLNAGNIWMKMLSVIGSGCGALLLISVLKFEAAYHMICGLGFMLSLISLGLTWRLPAQAPADPESSWVYNPWCAFDFVAQSLKHKFDQWAYIVGIAWFWILGSLILVFSAEYGRDILHARWSVVLFLSAGVFTIGYLAGSFLYARLTRRGNLFSYTVWIGLALSCVLMDLVFAGMAVELNPVDKAITVFKLLTTDADYWRVVIDVFFLGGLSAMYIVPFYTMIQKTTPDALLGRMISFSSMVNALGIVGTALIVMGLHLIFLDLLDIVFIFATANIFVSVYMVRLLPTETRRRVFRMILKGLFNARIEGLENLKKAGRRALIITNHTSYLDVLLISTFIDRKIVFAINDRLIDKTFVKFMTNLVDVRPLDPVSPFAVKDMAEELRNDELCMIFTEGIIEGGNTRMKIYEGPAMMAVKGNAPIVPIRIDGACHALFSRVLGKKADFRWFPDIRLTVLPPVRFDYPEDMPTREVREKSSSRLYDILSDMTFDSYEKDKPVFEALTRSMAMVGRFKSVMEDTERKPVKFFGVFMKAFILGRLIRRAISDEKHVGVMVPTSNTCALTVLGLHAFGKIPAMINFTSGPKQVVATCQTVGLKTVITARKVVMLAKLEGLVQALEEAGIRILYLEDLRPTLTTGDKVFGITAGFFPGWGYRKMSGGCVQSDDPAVILFTSGSEGMPKAVFLTHRNLLSNAYQIPSRIDVLPTDVFLNCLPMFHSFGLGAGTILPLLLGVKTVLYPTPLHYRIIPEICASTKATIFFGTDTFLAGYAKCANPYDFNSLRVVAAGAEKVKDETRKIWSEKFGVRILEGYGATECSPFISVNTFLHQRKNSVGRFLPGMMYQVKPVEGIKEGGELWVKGPNIMKGYMRYDKPMELDPPKDGWYDTGDIVEVDEDRYIFIKGRCKRFAKIGGEMVSLLAVEMIIEKKWPGFVTGAVNIPDPKKGEQIVLITTCKDINRDEMIAAFKAAGVTELGIPGKVIVTDTPPLLGTGKFDYVTAKEFAIKEVLGG